MRTAVEDASASQGFDTREAHLLQHNHNWVMRLPHAAPWGSVIAKVHKAGAGRDAVTRQVLIAEWLHESGILTARPAGTPWPIQVGAHLVTFTHDLGDGGPVTSEDLGHLLAQLHDLPVPRRDSA
ncbi:hypothetical protein [Kitasatospora sp. P5_F3]